MYICLRVKYPLFLLDVNETYIFSKEFWKILKGQVSKENPSSESRVVPCGRTDMTTLTVAFRKFAKAPKIVPSTFELSNESPKVQVKVKSTLEQTTKVQRCSRDVALLFP